VLVTPPEEAVIFVVPTATAVTVPASTVAALVLLEAHVAVLVMSNWPLHVVASALKLAVLGVLEALMLAFPGDKVID
jgi:hypothetical protein